MARFKSIVTDAGAAALTALIAAGKPLILTPRGGRKRRRHRQPEHPVGPGDAGERRREPGRKGPD